MTTPFDVWLHDQMNKSAVEALVPGQVGAGPNPGTTGSMDSAPEEATNTDLALQRYQQGAAPILASTDADGGAGYSHPAPGTSPSLQMFADVKAAAIIGEGEAFADRIYMEMKQANVANIAAKVRGAVSDVRTMAGNAAAKMTGRTHNPQAPVQSPQGHLANMAQGAQRKAQEAMAGAQAGAQRLQGQAGEAIGKAREFVDQGVRNAVNRGAAEAAQHPYAAMGIGAGAVAGAGTAGMLAGQAMQARQMDAKQASENRLANAAAAGEQYALQLLGQLQ